MADVNVAPVATTRSLTTAPNFTAGAQTLSASDTYYIPNDGRIILIASATTTANLTVETPASVDGLAVTDLVLALATAVRVIGPFPPAVYNDAQGRIKVTSSAAASMLAVRV